MNKPKDDAVVSDQAERSDHFNTSVLRRLYNPGNSGRGVAGQTNRRNMHVMLTPGTYSSLEAIVPVGKGKYGSSVVELALRIMTCAVGRLSVDAVANELQTAITNRTELARNLRLLADAVEK